MPKRPGREVLSTILLIGGVLAFPFLVVYLLINVIPEVLPGWVIQSVCFGFLCSVTLVGLLFGITMGFLWVLAQLYDSGYLVIPEEW